MKTCACFLAACLSGLFLGSTLGVVGVVLSVPVGAFFGWLAVELEG